MRRFVLALSLALALTAPALTGCGSTTTKDGQTIATPNARMATVELAFGKALDLVDAERKAGRLKGQRAADAAKLVEAAKRALDGARTAHRTNASNAVTALIAAEAAIEAVTIFLQPKASASWPDYAELR